MNPLKQVAPIDPIDPVTGMPVVQPQLGQIQPNPMMNSRALGSAQAKLPGMFPGSAFNQNQQTFNILNATTSKQAAASEAKRRAAQEEARAKRAKRALRKGASNGVTEAATEAATAASQEMIATRAAGAAGAATGLSQDVVSGETKTTTHPTKTYSNSSSKTIYNEDGTVSSKQTIK